MTCANPLVVNQNGNVLTLTNNNTTTMTVTANPAVAGFPMTLAAGANQSVTVTTPAAPGTYCYGLGYTCVVDDDGPPPNNDTHSASLTDLFINPAQATYAPSDQIDVAFDVTNTGTVDIDDLTVELVHDETLTEPLLVCPAGPLTDPTNFTMQAQVPEPPPFNAATINIDLRFNFNGTSLDPGPAPTYTYPGSGILNFSYDLTQANDWAQLSGQSGTLDICAVHWYDGDTEVLVPVQNCCPIDFDFTGF